MEKVLKNGVKKVRISFTVFRQFEIKKKNGKIFSARNSNFFSREVRGGSPDSEKHHLDAVR